MRKGSLERAEVRKVLAVLTLTTAVAAVAAVAVSVAAPAAAAPVWRGAAADAPWMRADFAVERPGVADEGGDGADLGDDGVDSGGDGGAGDDGGWSDPGPGDGGDGGDGGDEPPGDDPGFGGGWDDDGVTILPAPGDDCPECMYYTTTDLEGQPVTAPGEGVLQPGTPRGGAAAARERGSDDACKPLPGRALPAICQP